MQTKLNSIVERSVSERTGLIRHLHRLAIRHYDPAIHCFYAEAANSAAHSEFLAGDRNSGAGEDETAAKLATIGEFFERYCCSFSSGGLLGSSRELGLALDPEEFSLFSKEQYAQKDFPFVSFDDETVVSWTHATCLNSGNLALVPSQMVYMPYAPIVGEQHIVPQISHGLACHQTKKQATVSALLELIERDAFSTYWLAELPLPYYEISADCGCEASSTLRKMIGENYFIHGIKYFVFDITTDILVPSIFVIAKTENKYENVITVGAASRASYRDAMRKAFLETAQARPYIRHIRMTEPDWESESNFGNIRTFDEHARLYSYHPELLKDVKHLWANAGDVQVLLDATISCEFDGVETNDELGSIVSRIGTAGFNCYLTDLTTVDAAELGLTVVRAIVPGLHQLHGDHLFPFLGGTRLAKKIESRSARHVISYDVVYPHPFP